MSSLFSPLFWFTLQPASVGGLTGQVIFAFFVLLFVLGIVARIVSSQKQTDKYMRLFGQRVGVLLITMGLLGVLLYFFSYERIRFFGARFWYLFWLIGCFVWGIVLVRFVRTSIPAMKQKEGIRSELRKYFPPRKKRR